MLKGLRITQGLKILTVGLLTISLASCVSYPPPAHGGVYTDAELRQREAIRQYNNNVVGAVVAGAIIGGVVVAATNNRHGRGYYNDGYYNNNTRYYRRGGGGYYNGPYRCRYNCY